LETISKKRNATENRCTKDLDQRFTKGAKTPVEKEKGEKPNPQNGKA